MSDGVAHARHLLNSVLVIAPGAHGMARLIVNLVPTVYVVGLGFAELF